MLYKRWMPLWAQTMIVCIAWGGSARAETIFQFQYTFSGAVPLHTTHIPFSIRAGNGAGPRIFDGRQYAAGDLHKTFTMTRANEPDFDRFVKYLLNGRRDQLQFTFSTDKKNFSDAQICWGDNGDARIDLKGIKITNLHMRIESLRYVPPVQHEGFWKATVSFWSTAPSVAAPNAL